MKKENEKLKILERISKIMIEIRTNPSQKPEDLMKNLNVGKTQFYRDKKALEKIGFKFEYKRSKEKFIIIEDAMIPACNLTLSELFSLVLSIRQFSGNSEYRIGYQAIQAIKKLVASSEHKNIEEQLKYLLEDSLIKYNHGCKLETLEQLQNAFEQKRVISVMYQPANKKDSIIDDIRIYSMYYKGRALYIDLFSERSNLVLMYRLNRIKKIMPLEPPRYYNIPSDYNFFERHKNSFYVFCKPEVTKIIIYFKKEITDYIIETNWHYSQKIIRLSNFDVICEFEVCDPEEVARWVRRWGDKAEILHPPELRKKMLDNAKAEVEIYSKKNINLEKINEIKNRLSIR